MSLDPILAAEIEAIPLVLRTVTRASVLVAPSDAAASCDHPGRSEG